MILEVPLGPLSIARVKMHHFLPVNYSPDEWDSFWRETVTSTNNPLHLKNLQAFDALNWNLRHEDILHTVMEVLTPRS